MHRNELLVFFVFLSVEWLMITTCLITFRAQNRGTFGILSIYEWNEIAVLQKVQVIGCDAFN